VKKELKRLITQEKYKTALDIARESLKECQNFIKEFKPTSDYHLQIEKAISDLNNLIVDISSKSDEAEKSKQKEAEDLSANTNGNEKKYFKTKILSEEIRENATKIAETDMNFDDFPKTSYGVEKAFNSMKNRPDLFFNYLKSIDPNTLPSIYQSSEMSYHILIGIIQSLTKFTFDSEDNIKLTVKYFFNITKTKNFALLKKFLKRSDKDHLKNVFSQIKEKYMDVLNSFDVDLEKSYF
jgi:hypothetical protein